MHVVERPAADLALHELRAGVRRGRVDEPACRCRAGRAAGPYRSTPAAIASSRAAASAGSGTQITLPSSIEKLDRRSRARQPLRLVGVEQRVGGATVEHEVELPRQVGGVAQAGAHALAGERRHEVGGVAGEEDAPGAPLLGVAGVERVDGVALEPGVAGVHVPRREQLPRPRLVVELVERLVRAGA